MNRRRFFWNLAVAPAAVSMGRRDQRLNSIPDGVLVRNDFRLDGAVTKPSNGLHLGNGDLGLVVYGSPERVVFHLGKNDVWDRRVNRKHDTRPPTLSEIKAAASDAPPKIFTPLGMTYSYWFYPFPTPKPVGHVYLRVSEFQAADPIDQRVSLLDASHLLRAHGAAGSFQTTSYIDYHQNVLQIDVDIKVLKPGFAEVQMYRWPDLKGPAEIQKSTDRGAYFLTLTKENIPDKQSPENAALPPPKTGTEHGVGWIVQRFPADPTFPEGFECAQAGMVLGAKDASLSSDTLTWSLPLKKGANHFRFFLAVATTRDHPDPLAASLSMLKSKAPVHGDKLHQAHRKSWRDFWSMSRIELSDRVMERTWYQSLFLLRCCAKKGKVAPGMFANWLTADFAGWHGDYHLNYNFQQTFWGACAANHAELVEPYYDQIADLLPAAIAYARKYMELPGAFYPLCDYPVKREIAFYSNLNWDMTVELGAWVAQPFWWHYLYTGDRQFLADRAYPIMSSVAEFLASYVNEQPDGTFDIQPTCSPEHWGLTKNFERNRNTTSALALVSFHMEATAQAAATLGRDAVQRERWRHIARHLAPYPTHGEEEEQIVVDVEGAPPIEYNVPVPLFPIFPGEEISDRSPRKTRDLFWRTLETFKKISENGHVIVNASRVRVALPNAWELIKHDILDFIDANGASDTYNLGTVVENLSITLPITEFLLQSHEGLVRVFPGLPDSVDARFNSLRARGGFMVNSVRQRGKTRIVELWHEEGSLCLVENPWSTCAASMSIENESGRVIRPNALGQFQIKVPARKWLRLECVSKQ
jgi:alpha-L-fucosidase 2